MQHWIIVIAVIAIAVGFYMFIRKAKNNKDNTFNTEDSVPVKNHSLAEHETDNNAPAITMELLPANTQIDESSLSEITDTKVLARIDNLIPGLAQAGMSAANVVKAGSETVYRAIIPAGAKLTNSKAMEGAVRGFYRGADGIQGHANLVAVDQTAAGVANTAAAAMGVAAMVVGQYYMTQINSALTEINDGIEKIADFQDNEFKSRVFALIAQTKKITAFQTEIIDNDELRMKELTHLDKLEDECIQLLGQANLTLGNFSKKDGLDYDSYEKELHNAQSWYIYQQSLLDILYKISDLKYTLHLGNVTRSQCAALLPTYTKQVADAQSLLSSWHNDNAERLGIDVSDSKRKRQGFDGFIHWIPGLFDDANNYRPISETTAEMIGEQTSEQQRLQPSEKADLYNTDVQIISKDGKLYYLPSTTSIN